MDTFKMLEKYFIIFIIFYGTQGPVMQSWNDKLIMPN